MSDRGTGGTRGGDRPWYESLPDGRSWAALWSGYVRCACGAIWSMEAECPVCGEAPLKEEWVVVRDADGTEYRVPPVFNGADGRYEDWTWLRMLEAMLASGGVDNFMAKLSNLCNGEMTVPSSSAQIARRRASLTWSVCLVSDTCC